LENFFRVGGIPGNLPADTQWNIGINDANFADDEAMYFCIQPYQYNEVDDINNLNVFASGATESVGTTDNELTVTFLTYLSQFNRNYYAYVRCIDAGANLQARFVCNFGIPIYGDYQSIVPDAAVYKGFLVGDFFNAHPTDIDGVYLVNPQLNLSFRRTAAPAANLTVDYVLMMPELIKIEFSEIMTNYSFVLRGKEAYPIHSTYGYIVGKAQTWGYVQDVVPNMSNMVWVEVGKSGNANVTTRTNSWKIRVAPRWMLV
jgi:hypothetical protein